MPKTETSQDMVLGSFPVHDFLDITGVIVVILDRDGNIGFINRKGAGILGLKTGAIIGRNWYETFVPQAIRQHKFEAFRALFDAQAPPAQDDTTNCPVITALGEELIIAWHYAVLKDKEGRKTCILGIGDDITDRTRTEEMLQKARTDLETRVEERTVELMNLNMILTREIDGHRRAVEALAKAHEQLEATLEALPDMLFEIDISGVIHDYRAPDTISFLPPKKFLKKRIQEILPRDAHQEIMTAIKEAYRQGSRHSARYCVELPQGRKCYELSIARKGDPETLEPRFIALARDITQRRATEEELVQISRQWQTTFDAINDAVWLLDETFRIERANAATREIFGLEPSEIIGKHCWEVVHNTTSPIAQCPVMRLKSSMKREISELALGDKWLRVVADPILDEKGRLTGIVHTVRDATARKRDEVERERLRESLLFNQKMESIGVLAGGIAHDFNNLLMGIMGNIELALMDATLALSVRKNLTAAMHGSEQAAKLTAQMLAYSGKGHFILEDINLNELLEQMSDMLEASISKKINLRQRYEARRSLIHADQSQLRQLVMNLVINAAEAIADATGTITISTGNRHCTKDDLQSPWLNHEISEGEYVFLEVRDTGCGMDQDMFKKIFDPFFTSKFLGRGLGLPAVLGIIRGHHGAIKLESAPGQGTTFQLLFPVAQSPDMELPASGMAKPAETISRQTGPLILLVDDEETVLDIAGAMLGELGYRVVKAADGIQALELFRAQDKKDPFACIILDLTMPRKDGQETFEELLRINPDAPVIISSGYREDQIKARFSTRQPNGFLQKPYSLKVLKTKLQTLLGDH